MTDFTKEQQKEYLRQLEQVSNAYIAPLETFHEKIFWSARRSLTSRETDLDIYGAQGVVRPLWRDYSYWQYPVDFGVAVANDVEGACLRAGIGSTYVDPRFAPMWEAAKNHGGLYLHSYLALRPDQDVVAQADTWYRTNPELYQMIPRVIDLERQDGQSYQVIADKCWQLSEIVESRDGVRPIIYSRYMLVNLWLSSWTSDMHNEHWWWLAQYLIDRTQEHPGPPTLPNKVREDRVWLHQTADKKADFYGECGGSKSVDWNRMTQCETWEVDDWIALNFQDDAPNPPPPSNQMTFIVQTDTLNVREGPSTGYAIVRKLSKGDQVIVVDVDGSSAWARLEDGKYCAITYQGFRYMKPKVL